jgi:hypothetical protein
MMHGQQNVKLTDYLLGCIWGNGGYSIAWDL